MWSNLLITIFAIHILLLKFESIIMSYIIQNKNDLIFFIIGEPMILWENYFFLIINLKYKWGIFLIK